MYVNINKLNFIYDIIFFDNKNIRKSNISSIKNINHRKLYCIFIII